MRRVPFCVLATIASTAACSESYYGDTAPPADGGATPPGADSAPPRPGTDGSVPPYEGGTGPGPEDGGSGTNDDSPTAAPDAAPPPSSCLGPPARGATPAYVEYEAEDGTTNGTLIGPSRAINDPDVFQSIAGESSGRRAVKLAGTGQSVAIKSTCAANSIVVRYVIPDSADGSGISATLGVYVNGARVQSLNLTSHYAWAYGNPATTDATTNNPGDGYARHFYDEARALLSAEVPAGATVTLQQDASDTASYYVIDLVDLEDVPPPPSPPANAASITDYGATPDDGTDDGAAIDSCILDAQAHGRPVWIPPGTFDNSSTQLVVGNVQIQGAGMWHSTLRGASAQFICAGSGCRFADFSLLGEVTLRDDTHSVHAFGGPFGRNCRIEDVWLEHFTTGPWVGVGGKPSSDGLVVRGSRLRDLFADGINLSDGASNSVVEQTHARNTGDDAFASWSVASSPSNTNNVFRFDTAQLPWRANCYALYGGTGNSIQDSVCADVVTYNGIFVDQDFGSNSFGGATAIERDTILRAGGPMYGKQLGALTVSGHESAAPITGVQVQDVDIQDSTFSGVFLVGPKDAIDGLSLTNVTISGPGTYGIEVDPSAFGSATATSVVVSNPGTAGANGFPGGFTLNRGAGNSGW
jgi:Pectate lyase superfamily protein